jgi:hypothetical protein
MAYLAKVPAGKTAANWDGSGAVWFKVWEQGPTALNSNGGTWPTSGIYPLNPHLQAAGANTAKA